MKVKKGDLVQILSGKDRGKQGRVIQANPANRKVIAYLRAYGDEIVLCVANLSRTPQAVELDLSDWRGRQPVELLGRSVFPPIGELPYLLTLQGYSFFWFELLPVASEAAGLVLVIPLNPVPTFVSWATSPVASVTRYRLAMPSRSEMK